MSEAGALVLPALYLLTAALVVAVAIAQSGAIPYYIVTYPLQTAVVLGVPLVAWVLGSHEFIVLLHVFGAMFFVGAHATSVYVAFALPSEADRKKAEALLLLSGSALDWLHASLGFLVATGVAAGFAGRWWGEAWIWLSLDILLAITAYMYVAASSPAYTVARDALVDHDGPGWDEATRKLVDRRRALRLMWSGTAALTAIVALMILKPG